MAHAASSTICSECCSASAKNASMSAGRPTWCTGMIAFVRGVIARAAASGLRLPVAGSTSAKTGVAPHCQTELAVAMNESDGTMTSSPGPTPRAYSARCSAVVQLLVATA